MYNDGYFWFMAVLLIENYNYDTKKSANKFVFIDFTYVFEKRKICIEKK